MTANPLAPPPPQAAGRPTHSLPHKLTPYPKVGIAVVGAAGAANGVADIMLLMFAPIRNIMRTLTLLPSPASPRLFAHVRLPPQSACHNGCHSCSLLPSQARHRVPGLLFWTPPPRSVLAKGTAQVVGCDFNLSNHRCCKLLPW